MKLYFSYEGEAMKAKRDIGPKIRKIRLRKGLKLKDVAKTSGLSVSLISQIENNNSSPSLSTLIKLSDFLGKNTSFFLEETGKKASAVVCHEKDRKAWTSNDDKIYFELLNPSARSKKMEIVFAKIERFESPPEKYAHEGEEFGLVLKGQIQVEVGDEIHVMNKGDSIYFKSTIRHAIYGVDPKGSEIIWVNSPPIKIF